MEGTKTAATKGLDPNYTLRRERLAALQTWPDCAHHTCLLYRAWDMPDQDSHLPLSFSDVSPVPRVSSSIILKYPCFNSASPKTSPWTEVSPLCSSADDINIANCHFPVCFSLLRKTFCNCVSMGCETVWSCLCSLLVGAVFSAPPCFEHW